MTGRAWTLMVAITTIVVAIVLAVWFLDNRDPNHWLRVTSTETLADKSVVFDSELNIFVVSSSNGPLALSARVPHQRTDYVRFCPRSGLFESDDLGAKFDRLGIYYGGPGKRSLDRLRSKVEDGVVYVDPGQITQGPDRGAREPMPPRGPFCTPT